ncbi:MAG TPA: 4Fe-4S binding protein [Deltaproteobacteria bacterium]|nr:4Fe-4S binding protein [Deltaproteobacteria bacterium]
MKFRHLIWLRRTCQALFLAFFVFLVVETRLPPDAYFDYSLVSSEAKGIELSQPVSFFFHLDPLAWIASGISERRWIEGFGWAMALVVATFFLGRFFCGFICPLGTLNHMAGAFRPALKGKTLMAANQKKDDRKIKYFLLTAILVAAVLGMNYSGLLDPISTLFRSLALSVFPGIGIGLSTLFKGLAQSDIKLFNTIGYTAENLAAPVFGYGYKAFQAGLLIGALFLVILFLNRIKPRFWCRVLCPLGALLAVFSRYPILRLEKDESKCTHCGACVKSCQGAASCEPGIVWQNAECLACFNCQDSCREKALSFHFKWPMERAPGIDMGKRAFLGGVVAGLSVPLFGKLDGKMYKVSPPELIRPPGSLRESDFLARCQRCGLCMKVCPTNVIQPTWAEAGFEGFWTPVLVMTGGYCEYTCTLCGNVCPTGAIEKLAVKKKIQAPVRIGSAYLDRGRCLPWSGNGPCIVCEEHCPTSPKAIYLREESIAGADGKKVKVKLPFVDLKRCVGCGICENKCPVKGRPAIRVISAGESRSPENRILL